VHFTTKARSVGVVGGVGLVIALVCPVWSGGYFVILVAAMIAIAGRHACSSFGD